MTIGEKVLLFPLTFNFDFVLHESLDSRCLRLLNVSETEKCGNKWLLLEGPCVNHILHLDFIVTNTFHLNLGLILDCHQVLIQLIIYGWRFLVCLHLFH